MARSGKRKVMEYDGLEQFRRRRLLAFLRRNNLPATFNAMKHETRAFFDVRFLQRLVVDGRWQEARGYVKRFLPSRDDQMLSQAHTTLRFIAQLNVLDDLANGKLGGNDAADDLEMQIQAIPPSMDDPHYTEAVRTVFNARSHPAYWGPVDWQLVRLKASQIVKDLITKTPKFKRLMRLPRCPIHPCYTIPFGFQRCRKRKKIGQTPASLLARRFHPKERCSPSPWTQGSSSEPMYLDGLIDLALLAGNLEVSEHSDFSGEGTPGAPVVLCIGKNCGESPATAATKRLSEEECYAESAGGAKRLHTTGDFCPDVDTPSSGMDPMRVLQKVNELQEISRAMTSLLLKICTHGPERRMFLEKLLGLEKVQHELRVESMNAAMKDCTSGMTAAPESSASFSCT